MTSSKNAEMDRTTFSPNIRKYQVYTYMSIFVLKKVNHLITTQFRLLNLQTIPDAPCYSVDEIQISNW